MAETGISWEIVHCVTDRMVSEWNSAVFLSEGELSLDGLVQSVIDGRRDSTELALKDFVAGRSDDYEDYIREQAGSGAVPSYSIASMRMYVEERGLHDELENFRADNEWRWNSEYRRGSVRDEIVQDTVVPLLANVAKNSLYIYRDRDHCAVHVKRLLLG